MGRYKNFLFSVGKGQNVVRQKELNEAFLARLDYIIDNTPLGLLEIPLVVLSKTLFKNTVSNTLVYFTHDTKKNTILITTFSDDSKSNKIGKVKQARKVLNEIESYAKKHNVNTIRTSLTHFNPRHFEKLGFKQRGFGIPGFRKYHKKL